MYMYTHIPYIFIYIYIYILYDSGYSKLAKLYFEFKL